MAGGICQVNLIATVAVVFGIGSRSCALHDLPWPEIHFYMVILVGHGETGNGGMPVDAPPAQIDVLRVVAEDEG